MRMTEGRCGFESSGSHPILRDPAPMYNYQKNSDQSTWSSNIREERDALESSLETIALSEVLELELSSTRWNL